MRSVRSFFYIVGVLTASVALAQVPETSPVFDLGEVLIVGGEQESAPDTAAAGVNLGRMRAGDRRDLAETVTLIPEVSMSRSGMRNEALLFVRGFDQRQVPLFVDGIPMYLPYEGSVDPGRLLMFSAGDVSVSRGFSPVIYGPNTLGGAINIVTRRPVRPREAEVLAGAFSGDGLEGGLRAGLMNSNSWYQVSLAGRSQEYFPLSDDFRAAGAEDGGRRENSSRRDILLDAKAAWTPAPGDEFSVGFVRVDSRKDVPPYAGDDPTVQPRYWRYPEWEKNSLYFIGRASLGLDSYLKMRVYDDTYKNTLESFDDDTYSTQTRPYTFTSYYDDRTYGAGAEWGTRIGRHHAPRISAQYKRDLHREHNRGQAESEFSDWTASFGLEDSISIGEPWTLAVGMAYERRENIEAVNRSGPVREEFPDNANDSVNPQAGIFYSISGGVFRATIAQKSRFPTLKDRYSYRRGLAIPNPELDEEKAVHYEIGYDGRIVPTVTGRIGLYVSRLRDAIQEVDDVRFDAATDTWLAQYRNIGKAEHRGIDAGLNWTACSWLKTGADYALLDRENTSHPELKPVDTPKHRFLAYAEVQPLSRLVIASDVEYDSERYSTSDGTKVDSFWVANVHLRVSMPHGWKAVVGVRNLLDENYELSEGYPEEGRSYYARASWMF